MNPTSNDGYYEVLWPRAPRQTGTRRFAKRLETLQGKTIAQLWDFVFRGDEVFALLQQELKVRFPGIRFIDWNEFGSTHGGKEREMLAALPQRLKDLGVDAAISGMAA